MKNIFLLIIASFGLLACSPQDPAVLTQKEKDYQNRPRGPRTNSQQGFSTNDRATLPNRVELYASHYLLDRQTEILKLLSFSLAASEVTTALHEQLNFKNAQELFGQCSKIQKSTDIRSNGSIRLQVYFQNCESKLLNESSLPVKIMLRNGKMFIDIKLDNNKQPKAILVTSAEPSSVNSLNAELRVAYRPKDSAFIQENLALEYVRDDQDSNVWMLFNARHVAVVNLNLKDKEQHSYDSEFFGKIKIKEINSAGLIFENDLVAKLKVQAQKSSSTQPAFYIFEVSKEMKVKTTTNDKNLQSGNEIQNLNPSTELVRFNGCGERQGQYFINLSYKYSVVDQLVSYEDLEVNLLNNKGQKSSIKLTGSGLGSCYKEQSMLVQKNAFFPVDWSMHFLQ